MPAKQKTARKLAVYKAELLFYNEGLKAVGWVWCATKWSGAVNGL